MVAEDSGQKNVGAVEVTEVPNPVRIEDRLAASHRQSVESADRTTRVVFQIIEIRRVVTLVHAFHESEVNLHQIFDPIEDAPDVFGIEMTRHFFHRAIYD